MMRSGPPQDLFDRRPLVALALLTLLFYWKLALSSQFTFLETPDLAYQVLPWYQFQARAMHSGVFPLWDPYQWTGQPVLGQMQPGAAFPLNWPLFLAPLQNGYLNLRYVHWHFVLMHFLAAAFMYAFCRQLGSSRFASVLAGAAFSFGGHVGTVVWPQMLHGALWIPLIFLFLHRMVARARGRAGLWNASLCGVSIGFSLLSGHHQAPMFTLLALGGVFLYWFLAGGARRARLGALLLVALGFAFLVGALQLLPALEYGARAYRWVEAARPIAPGETVPYYAQYNLGLFPLSLLGTVFPKAHLTTDPFLGLVCLSFAFFAVAAGWSLVRVRIYGVLALGAIAYAAGHYSLFHGVLYAATPWLDKARSPGHAIFVFQFAALALAAQGLDLFLGEQEPGWEVWRNRILKGLVGIGLLSWILLFWLYLNLKFETDPGDRVILSSLVAFLLAAVLYGHHRGRLTRGTVRLGLLLLLVFELGIPSYFFFSHREDPKRATHLKRLAERADVMRFLRAQPRPFRFDVSSPADWPANLGDWEGLEATRGYLASVSDKLYEFSGWDWGRSSLLLNTVYVVGRAPARPEQREVFQGAGGWRVFRNDDAFPRAWMVHRVRQVRQASQAAELFRSPEFDARRETVLIGDSPAPRLEPCQGESQVEITWHGLHRIRARSRARCAGLVVFGEPAFPGWQAMVDGAPAQLYAPFGALRGVATPAGEHAIELVYRPRSVYWGAALSMLGLLGCAALGVWCRGWGEEASAARDSSAAVASR